MNSPIYFISQDISGYPHSDQIEDMCRAGVQLLQFRSKTLTFEQQILEGKKIREVCTKYHSFFIVNDNPHLALACDADGVHLGSDDCSIIEARKLLGDDKIIGFGCSTIEELLSIIDRPLDYISIGPYKPSNTKKNLSKIVGIEGYNTLFEKLPPKLPVPIFAVGGINLDAVEKLAKLPFSGLAMSELLVKHNFKNLLVNQIKELFAQGKRMT